MKVMLICSVYKKLKEKLSTCDTLENLPQKDLISLIFILLRVPRGEFLSAGPLLISLLLP